jgi:hypothetical protein
MAGRPQGPCGVSGNEEEHSGQKINADCQRSYWHYQRAGRSLDNSTRLSGVVLPISILHCAVKNGNPAQGIEIGGWKGRSVYGTPHSLSTRTHHICAITQKHNYSHCTTHFRPTRLFCQTVRSIL